MANHFGRMTLVSMFSISDPSHYQQGETVPCLCWSDRCYRYEHPLLLIMSSIGVSRRTASHPLAGMERQSKKCGRVGRRGPLSCPVVTGMDRTFSKRSKLTHEWAALLPTLRLGATAVHAASRPLLQLPLASPAWARDNITHAVADLSLKPLTSLLREHRSWPVRWVPHLHCSISGNIQMHEVSWRMEKCLFLLWKPCSCLLMTDVGPKLCWVSLGV